MKRSLAAICAVILLSAAMNNDIALAKNTAAIETLHEYGIIYGGERGLEPERYMTCAEFIAAASRMGSEDHASAERSFGDWKEAAMWSAYGLCVNDETYEYVKEHFDEPVTPALAREIMTGMMSPDYITGEEFGYYYWLSGERSGVIRFESLSDIGYDTSVIPEEQYITREEACEMLCEMFYIEYPAVGDYRPCVTIERYTPHGVGIVRELGAEEDIGKELFGKHSSGDL